MNKADTWASHLRIPTKHVYRTDVQAHGSFHESYSATELLEQTITKSAALEPGDANPQQRTANDDRRRQDAA